MSPQGGVYTEDGLVRVSKGDSRLLQAKLKSSFLYSEKELDSDLETLVTKSS